MTEPSGSQPDQPQEQVPPTPPSRPKAPNPLADDTRPIQLSNPDPIPAPAANPAAPAVGDPNLAAGMPSQGYAAPGYLPPTPPGPPNVNYAGHAPRGGRFGRRPVVAGIIGGVLIALIAFAGGFTGGFVVGHMSGNRADRVAVQGPGGMGLFGERGRGFDGIGPQHRDRDGAGPQNTRPQNTRPQNPQNDGGAGGFGRLVPSPDATPGSGT